MSTDYYFNMITIIIIVDDKFIFNFYRSKFLNENIRRLGHELPSSV